MVAPFIIGTIEGILLACVGLSLMAMVAYSSRIYSIVVCNIVGIVGYMFTLFT